MSSLEDIPATKLLAYIRGHWGIENRCHWVLDAIHRVDHNQTRDRNSAANYSILRRMALNTHNRMPGTDKRRNSLLKRKMLAALNPAYLEQRLFLVQPPWVWRWFSRLASGRFLFCIPACAS